MKKVGVILLTIFLSSTAFAQGKYGSDSATCVTNLSLYRDYYKQMAFEDAYKFWNVTFRICPASSERMYVDGVNLMRYQIKNAANNELQAAYIDTLMMIYDKRIENFGGEGKVLGRKGADMLRYKRDDVEGAYNTLTKSFELTGDGSESGAIVSLITAAVKMEKAELIETKRVVELFVRASDVNSLNIEKYKGQKAEEYYVKAQAKIEELAGPYLSCEILVELANNNYEKNKENTAWLERAAELLDKKGCIDAPIFFTIAKQMHKSSPSAVSAEKMGVMSLKNKEYNEAIAYFQQAIEMAEGDDKMYDYNIELATAYSSKGAYSEARKYARKAATIDGTQGLPYLMIGDMIAGSSSACDFSEACKKKALYWLATDYFNKAKSVDPSVREKANTKIASYKKYYPTKEECFFLGVKEGDTIEIGCWIGESTKARF